MMQKQLHLDIYYIRKHISPNFHFSISVVFSKRTPVPKRIISDTGCQKEISFG